jgi:membrane protease YdiL (CAAX protease family)
MKYPFSPWTPEERKAAYILGGIAACECVWVYFNVVGNQARFLRYIGTSNVMLVGMVGWISSFSVTALFVAY